MLVIERTLVVAVSYWVVYWMALAAVNCDVVMTPRRQNDSKTGGDGEYDVAMRLAVAVAGDGQARVRQCTERVSSVEMCRGAVRYNATGWPNFIGHDSLVDAETQLRTFSPLVQYGCARRHLQFFLCAVYVPMCTEKVPDVIGPCRPVCERVRQQCEPLLQNFGFPWPAALNCSRFPARNDDTHMCMDGPSVDDEDQTDDIEHLSSSKRHDVRIQFNSNTTNAEAERSDANDGKRDSATATSDSSSECLHNKTACRAPCIWVTTANRVVSMWMMVMAVICLVSTVFCIVTYVIDTRRFVYAQHVIVCMASCSAVCAVTILASLIVTPPTAFCHSDDPITATSNCTIIFVVLYYFSLSCATWWVVLNVVWLLTCGLRWSEIDVRQLTTWFHVVAWTVPAVPAVVLLVRKDIELDVVSGLCRVMSGTVSQLAFVITPLLVCLVVGLTLSVVALVCSRLRQQEHESSKSSEALSAHVWVVSMVAGIVLSLYTASVVHEFTTHQYMHTADDDVTSHTVSTSMTVVRVICPLLIGVITVPWMMLSGQATASWRMFVRRQLADRWQCCAEEAADKSAISRSPTVTVTSITSHQLLPDDVIDPVHYRATERHHQQRYHLYSYQYQQQQQQQQQLMRQHISCRDFCTAHAHHQQQQRRFL